MSFSYAQGTQPLLFHKMYMSKNDLSKVLLAATFHSFNETFIDEVCQFIYQILVFTRHQCNKWVLDVPYVACDLSRY